MFALITGASKGIGKEMAYQLAIRGYDLILVARSKELLNEIAIDISTKYEKRVICMDYDLQKKENIEKLFLMTKDFEIEVVINNAGLGRVGMFTEIEDKYDDLMIDLNVIAMHKVLKEFSKRMEHGYILNVSSIAGFAPGPKMATYYASKNYILALSRAVNFEMKKQKKKVSVTALCPGPVNTNFNDTADVKFALKGMNVSVCTKKALKGLFKKKMIVLPGFKIKIAAFFMKLLPSRTAMKFCFRSQSKKNNK